MILTEAQKETLLSIFRTNAMSRFYFVHDLTEIESLGIYGLVTVSDWPACSLRPLPRYGPVLLTAKGLNLAMEMAKAV